MKTGSTRQMADKAIGSLSELDDDVEILAIEKPTQQHDDEVSSDRSESVSLLVRWNEERKQEQKSTPNPDHESQAKAVALPSFSADVLNRIDASDRVQRIQLLQSHSTTSSRHAERSDTSKGHRSNEEARISAQECSLSLSATSTWSRYGTRKSAEILSSQNPCVPGETSLDAVHSLGPHRARFSLLEPPKMSGSQSTPFEIHDIDCSQTGGTNMDLARSRGAAPSLILI